MIDDEKESEWWWIDYLEDEFDESINTDLERLLHCSSEDRDLFEAFRTLRSWIKRSDPIEAGDLTLTESSRTREAVMSIILKERRAPKTEESSPTL